MPPEPLLEFTYIIG